MTSNDSTEFYPKNPRKLHEPSRSWNIHSLIHIENPWYILSIQANNSNTIQKNRQKKASQKWIFLITESPLLAIPKLVYVIRPTYKATWYVILEPGCLRMPALMNSSPGAHTPCACAQIAAKELTSRPRGHNQIWGLVIDFVPLSAIILH